MSELLANTARLHRAIGVKRPRRRVPQQIPPSAIEREYARALMPFVAVARAAFEPLLAELPALLAGAAADRHDREDSGRNNPSEGTIFPNGNDRADAGEGRRAAELIAEAKARLAGVMSSSDLAGLAERFAGRVSEHNRAQLVRQVRAAVGVDVFTNDRRVPALVEGFVAENVELIKDIPTKVATEIAQMTTRAVASGTRHEVLAADIQERLGFGVDRAKLIARDQVGKLYGQINIARQRELGGEFYFWRTVGDQRVRPEHVALNGQRFRYDDPPTGGHPGTAVLCRCMAEPDFNAILDNLAGNTPDAAVQAEPVVEAQPFNPIQFNVGTPTHFGVPTQGMKEATAWGREAFQSWHASLVESELDALEEYKGHGFKSLNLLHRDPAAFAAKYPDPRAVAGWQAESANLTKALDAARMPVDLVAFRGELIAPDKLVPGNLLINDGFHSTTLADQVADRFVKNHVDTAEQVPALFEVQIPKGSKAAYIMNDKEAEILIQRGARMRIHEVTYDEQRKIRVVKVRLEGTSKE